MNSSGTRWLIIDDTDPSFQYSGDWNGISGTSAFDSLGLFGSTYNNSLHSPKSKGASITFPFDGIGVTIIGTLNVSSDATSIPDVTCTINGVQITADSLDDFRGNNVEICDSGDLPDGHHELVLTVNSPGSENTLAIDSIQYLPSANVSINNATLQLNHDDTAVSLKPGWDNLDDFNWFASTVGTSLTLTFHGVSASMYGFIFNGTYTDSRCSYAIDGSSPTFFTQPGSKSSKDVYNNVFLFETPPLPLGTHSLTVTDGDHESASPLTFVYFEINNGSVPTPSGGAAQNGTGPGVSTTSKKSLPTAAIAGIVVGAVVLLLAGVAIAFFLKRKQRKAVKELNEKPDLEVEAFPFAGRRPVLPASSSPHSEPSSPPQEAASPEALTPAVEITEPANRPAPLQMPNQRFTGAITGDSMYATGLPSSPTFTSRSHAATARSVVPSSDGYVDHMDSGKRFSSNERTLVDREVDVPPRYTTN